MSLLFAQLCHSITLADVCDATALRPSRFGASAPSRNAPSNANTRQVSQADGEDLLGNARQPRVFPARIRLDFHYDLQAGPWEQTSLVAHSNFRGVDDEMRERLGHRMAAIGEPQANVIDKAKAYEPAPASPKGALDTQVKRPNNQLVTCLVRKVEVIAPSSRTGPAAPY